MEGNSCPRCNSQFVFRSTTNEWQFYCEKCDIRFNYHNEIVLREDSWRPKKIEGEIKMAHGEPFDPNRIPTYVVSTEPIKYWGIYSSTLEGWMRKADGCLIYYPAYEIAQAHILDDAARMPGFGGKAETWEAKEFGKQDIK